MGRRGRGPSTSDIRSVSERSHVITYKLSVFKPYTNKPTLSMGFYTKNKKPLVEPLRSPFLSCAHKEAESSQKTAVRSNADRRSFSRYFIQPDGYPGR